MLCQLKKQFKDLRQRLGSCWEERNIIVFPPGGVNDFLPTPLIVDGLRPPWLLGELELLSQQPPGHFAGICLNHNAMI